MIEALLKADDAIVVCETLTKRLALRAMRERGLFRRVRFMTRRDFLDAALFPMSDRIAVKLSQFQNQPLEVVEAWLPWLYGEADAQTERLTTLASLRAGLKREGLCTPPMHARALFHRKTVIVDFMLVDDALEKALLSAKSYGASIVKIAEEKSPSVGVWHETDADQAIARVATAIRQAHDDGIALDDIAVMVADSAYIGPTKRIFRAFGIPFNNQTGTLLAHTATAKRFLSILENSSEELEVAMLEAYASLKENRHPATRAIRDEALRALEACDTRLEAMAFLRYRFARRKIINQPLRNAVSISVFNHEKTRDLTRLFVLGCAEGMFPSYRSAELMRDDEREALGFWPEAKLNLETEKAVVRALNQPDEVVLSVARDVYGDTHVPSGLLSRYPDASKPVLLGQVYSEAYDTFKGKEAYDAHRLYGAKRDYLRLVNDARMAIYDAYDHRFDGIHPETLKQFIPSKPTASYSSLQRFYACRFRYYAEHVLRLRPHEENFTLDIGNVFHDALERSSGGVALEAAINKARDRLLALRDLTAKERFFLDVTADAIRRVVPIVLAQRRKTTYAVEATEKKVTYDAGDIVHKGFFDQVLSRTTDAVLDTLIIDYKTGQTTLDLRKAMFGLSGQLVYYVWLLMKTDPGKRRVRGFYEQTVFYRPAKLADDETMDEALEKHLAWKGYTEGDVDALLAIDPGAEDASFIRGAGITKQGKLPARFKTFTAEALDDLIARMDQVLQEATDAILSGDFTINPKTDGKHDLSCRHCPFKDVCYKTDDDYVTLDVPNDDVELFQRLRQRGDKR